MSMQDKLADAFSGYQRKCYDLAVELTGTEHELLLLREEVDDYGDVQEMVLQKKSKITAILNIPSNVPVDRMRTLDNLTNEVPIRNVSLFDALPIEMFVKFTDNVARGDILVKKIYFDHAQAKQYFLVLEVADIEANIAAGHLIWQQVNVAPCTKALSPLIRDYLQFEVGVPQQKDV